MISLVNTLLSAQSVVDSLMSKPKSENHALSLLGLRKRH